MSVCESIEKEKSDLYDELLAFAIKKYQEEVDSDPAEHREPGYVDIQNDHSELYDFYIESVDNLVSAMDGDQRASVLANNLGYLESCGEECSTTIRELYREAYEDSEAYNLLSAIDSGEDLIDQGYFEEDQINWPAPVVTSLEYKFFNKEHPYRKAQNIIAFFVFYDDNGDEVDHFALIPEHYQINYGKGLEKRLGYKVARINYITRKGDVRFYDGAAYEHTYIDNNASCDCSNWRDYMARMIIQRNALFSQEFVDEYPVWAKYIKLEWIAPEE